MPCILQAHYHSGARTFHEAFFYPLSSEFGEQQACMGEVSDFPMDSLCNQIIQDPLPITGEELEEFNKDFEDFWDNSLKG